MKNKIARVATAIFLCLSSCVGSPKVEDERSPRSTRLESLSSIPFGAKMDDVIYARGEPTKKVFDETDHIGILYYAEKQGQTVVPRETFYFDNAGILFSKALHIHAGESEASLGFWKKRYPASEMKVTRKERKLSADAYSFEEHIDLNASQQLEVRDNRVIGLFWTK